MTIINSNTTFTLNGVSDFVVGGQTQSWDGGFIGNLDIHANNPAPASYTVTASLTGSNWSMGRFAIGGSSSAGTIVKAIVNDNASGSGRFIELLNLYGVGGNQVTLTKTEIASVMGSSGADSITTSTSWIGSIQLFEGNDVVNVTGGNVDDLNLGSGTNRLSTSGAATWVGAIQAYSGNDTVSIGVNGVGSLALGDGNNTVSSAGYVDSIVTYDGADRVSITATGGAGMIDVGDGANIVTLSGFVSFVSGGGGNDTYNLNAQKPLHLNDWGGVDTITTTISRDLGDGKFPAIEKLTLLGAGAINGHGNGLSNTMLGNAAANSMNGGAGNDTIRGNGGNDTIYGNVGNDNLGGGIGNDRFVFHTAPNSVTNRDVIVDFANAAGNNDSFAMENAIFTKLGAGAPHALNAAFFRAGATALDANDYIVYNKATGALFYDANGNGAGGAIQFATLSTKPTLTASDFVVI